jgi:Leucine-rich repeat (LRR) protein
MIKGVRRAESGWAAAALLAQLGCGLATGGRVDSESHFLECVVDADCAAMSGASCQAGVCSVDGPPSEMGVDPAQVGPSDLPTPGAPTELADCPLPDGVEIRDQPSIDALEGCVAIAGNLDIAFPADLRPLHALRRVTGNLSIRPTLRRQPSLEGLESLEQVDGDLLLKSLSVSSLASLARLSSIATLPGSRGLTLEDSTELRDFSGLERLSGLRGLHAASNAQLTSLAPLSFAGQLGDFILEDNPLLTDLEALRPVSVISELVLSGSPLVHLDAFTGVRRVVNLSLLGNEELRDTSALLQLQSLQSLFLTDNPLLDAFVVSLYLSGLQQVWISHNATLTKVSGLDHFSELGFVTVLDNPQLAALSLVGLETLPSLELIRNSSLAQLDLGGAFVRDLVVVSNASLAPSQLDALAVSAWQTKIAGNQGQPTGFVPCPFENDGYCDAAPKDTLCAAGTDLSDCSDQRSDIDP